MALHTWGGLLLALPGHSRTETARKLPHLSPGTLPPATAALVESGTRWPPLCPMEPQDGPPSPHPVTAWHPCATVSVASASCGLLSGAGGQTPSHCCVPPRPVASAAGQEAGTQLPGHASTDRLRVQNPGWRRRARLEAGLGMWCPLPCRPRVAPGLDLGRGSQLHQVPEQGQSGIGVAS